MLRPGQAAAAAAAAAVIVFGTRPALPGATAEPILGLTRAGKIEPAGRHTPRSADRYVVVAQLCYHPSNLKETPAPCALQWWLPSCLV